jgi:hypothetical protein
MSVAQAASREAAQAQNAAGTGSATDSAATESRGRARRTAPTQPARPTRYASDDEILGIGSAAAPALANAAGSDADFGSGVDGSQSAGDESGLDTRAGQPDEVSAADPSVKNDAAVDKRLQAALDASPELRRAWQDAHAYRETFATPEEARAATALLGDLDRMDALFFSQRPGDHAELARAVASLDPAAFASLARAMNELAANASPAAVAVDEKQSARGASRGAENPGEPDTARSASQPSARNGAAQHAPSPAQLEFLHAANASAVQGVLEAIETQVDRLLPEGVSKTARNRVIGEIYRELDESLAANRQLGQQMRDVFRSGSLDEAHQRAVVAMVTGRARQALPGIAKLVLNEWTSTVVAANQDRLARQRTAAHRVEIAGSGRGGDGGRRPVGPRDIDYGRMSDFDILNL